MKEPHEKPTGFDAYAGNYTELIRDPIRERFARHYADVAALWQHPARAAALARLDLLERVVKHKAGSLLRVGRITKPRNLAA